MSEKLVDFGGVFSILIVKVDGNLDLLLYKGGSFCLNIFLLMWWWLGGGRQWCVKFDRCSTIVPSEKFLKVFLVVEKGRIVGDIPTHKKMFNYMGYREDMKIFKEVWRTQKRITKYKENTH